MYFLRSAVRVIPRVAEHRYGTSGQIDDVRFTERVVFVAQIHHISLG